MIFVHDVKKFYACHLCRATGVALYRHYNVFLDHQILYCRECAEQTEGAQYKENGVNWSIGNLVAAVPTLCPKPSGELRENTTYWGTTSTPDFERTWWLSQPVLVVPKSVLA